MKTDIQTTNIDSLDNAARTELEDKLQELARYFSRLIGVDAHLSLEGQHHSVQLTAHLPRSKFLKTHAKDRSLDAAFNDALGALKTQLVRQKGKRSEHTTARKARASREETEREETE